MRTCRVKTAQLLSRKRKPIEFMSISGLQKVKSAVLTNDIPCFIPISR